MVFCIEILIRSKVLNARVYELPITLFKDGRKNSKSHLRTISDGFKTLKFFLICCPKWLYFIPSLLFLLFLNILIGTMGMIGILKYNNIKITFNITLNIIGSLQFNFR